MARHNKHTATGYVVTAITDRDVRLDFEKIVAQIEESCDTTLQIKFLQEDRHSIRRLGRAVRVTKNDDSTILYLAYQHGPDIFAYLEKKPGGKLYIFLV